MWHKVWHKIVAQDGGRLSWIDGLEKGLKDEVRTEKGLKDEGYENVTVVMPPC